MVTRIEFIRSKLSNFSAQVSGVSGAARGETAWVDRGGAAPRGSRDGRDERHGRQRSFTGVMVEIRGATGVMRVTGA